MQMRAQIFLWLMLSAIFGLPNLPSQSPHRQNKWNWAGYTAPNITIPSYLENEPLVIVEAAFTLKPLQGQIQGYLRIKFQNQKGILKGNAFLFPYNPDPLYFNHLTPDFLPPVFSGSGLSLLAGRNITPLTPTPLMFLEKKQTLAHAIGYQHFVAIRELEAPMEVEIVFQHPMTPHHRWLLMFPWPCLKAEVVVEAPAHLLARIGTLSSPDESFELEGAQHFIWINLPPHPGLFPLTQPEKITGVQWDDGRSTWFSTFGEALRARPQPAPLLYATPTDAYHAKLNEVGKRHGFLSLDTPLIQKLRGAHHFLQLLHFKPDSLEKTAISIDQAKYFLRKDTLREKDVLKITEDLLYRILADHYLLFTRPCWMASKPYSIGQEIFSISALWVCDEKDSVLFWPRWKNLNRPVNDIPYYLEGAWALLVPRSLTWPVYHQRETMAQFKWIQLPRRAEPAEAILRIQCKEEKENRWMIDVQGEGIWKNWIPFADPWLWPPPVKPGVYPPMDGMSWPWEPSPNQAALPVDYKEIWIIPEALATSLVGMDSCGLLPFRKNAGTWELFYTERANQPDPEARKIRRCVLNALKEMVRIGG